jgi:hypothetical protein
MAKSSIVAVGISDFNEPYPLVSMRCVAYTNWSFALKFCKSDQNVTLIVATISVTQLEQVSQKPAGQSNTENLILR